MKPRKTIVYLGLCIVACIISVGAMFDGGGKSVTVKYVDRFSGQDITKDYKTDHETVGEFFSHNKITPGEFDKVSHNPENAILDGTEITITKTVPVSISHGGNVLTTVTSMPTVNGALLEAGMMPGENDIISPGINEPVTEGMKISITTVTSDEITEIEYIDFETKKVEDKNLEKGKTKVVQQGKKGEIQITYQVTYKNGNIESKTEVGREVLSEPVEKIVATGTKTAEKTKATPKATKKPAEKSAKKTETPVKASASKNTSAAKATAAPTPAEKKVINGLTYTKKMTMTATAYSAFNKSGGYAKTATGIPARKGVVAVDKRVIPLGTRLYIEGYGEAIAADVGGAVKGNIIDLCFEDTNANLKKFGRQKVQVYILE